MKKIKPLSVKQIDNAKPKDTNYRLYDGDGLSILIRQSSKIWHFSYQRPITKKRTMLSLGTYPRVSLVDARIKRDEYRSLLAQNIDPQQHIKGQELEKLKSNANTFYVVSQEWLSKQSYRPNTITAKKRLLFIAYQYLKDKPVSEITALDILTICEDIAEKYTPSVADYVKGVISQTLDFAMAKRMIAFNSARNLIRTHKKHQKKNHPAITEVEEFAQFLKDTHTIHLNRPYLDFLQIAPYLFVRPAELVSMHIDDIDFENSMWKYTPTKTANKTGVQMVVPLAHQILSKIKALLAWHGQSYVFASMRKPNQPIAYTFVNRALVKVYGGKQTLHGLRATARTILEEVLEYDPKYIEMQLGHQVKDPNGTAYNRAKYLKQRTEMMQKWADFIDELKNKKTNHP